MFEEQKRRSEPKTDQDKKDEKEKGGGKRKRRTSYSSGRREKLGMKRKRPGVHQDVKKMLGTQNKKDTQKRSISSTPFASNHRWKKH